MDSEHVVSNGDLGHTHSHSLPKTLFAFASLLSTSLSILASNVGMYPKLLNLWTAFSSDCSMKMLGGWYSSCGA